MRNALMMIALSLFAGSFAFADSKVESELLKIDACMEVVFKEGRAKHGNKSFEKILAKADEKTNMFEDEEHCFNEKAGADLLCQAKVLKGALKVLITDMKLESLRAKGQVCENF